MDPMRHSLGQRGRAAAATAVGSAAAIAGSDDRWSCREPGTARPGWGERAAGAERCFWDVRITCNHRRAGRSVLISDCNDTRCTHHRVGISRWHIARAMANPVRMQAVRMLGKAVYGGLTWHGSVGLGCRSRTFGGRKHRVLLLCIEGNVVEGLVHAGSLQPRQNTQKNPTRGFNPVHSRGKLSWNC
jgi:hypothetical protein